MQPAWSPNGKRIAFWGLRGGQGGTGRRDIWTVAAEGGEAVSVTDDEAIDWCPVWSGDGRYLYFSSGRGGTMNAWRVPIDEATGQTQGPPEPITTPSRSSSFLALSRDGTRLAYVAKEGRSRSLPRRLRPGARAPRGRARSRAGRLARDEQPEPLPRRWVDHLRGRRPAREHLLRSPGRDGLPPDHRRRVPQPRTLVVGRRQPDHVLLEPQRALPGLRRPARRQRARAVHRRRRLELVSRVVAGRHARRRFRPEGLRAHRPPAAVRQAPARPRCRSFARGPPSRP